MSFIADTVVSAKEVGIICVAVGLSLLLIFGIYMWWKRKHK